jgi:hypothetical protein
LTTAANGSTNVNTDMLHSRPIYEQFLPGVKNPTREAAEEAFPVLQAMPIPYVEAEDISNAVTTWCLMNRGTSPACS